MPANVEIKCRLDGMDVDWLTNEALVLSKNCLNKGSNGVGDVILLEQADTFFNCVLPGKRLKLREEVINGQPNKTQLIVYARPDQTGPKFCDYSISRFDASEAQQLKSVLTQSLGVRGEVVKSRKVVLIGQTRVHIDKVEGLGNFLELEVCMRDGQTVEEGQKIAEDIMKSLKVPMSNLVAPAYMDLLLEKAKTCCQPK